MFEKEYEATPIIVTIECDCDCDCDGEFKMDKYGPSMVTMIDPPQYLHTCNKCGVQEHFKKSYPYIKYLYKDGSVV